jgi:hypothetical protein
MIFGRIFDWILSWAREHRFIASSLAILVVVVAAACGRLVGFPGLK